MACFYFLWPQPRKGNTSNRRSLLSDARPSGQAFFGFLQQNMACYPRHSVSKGKTQFVLGTAGSTAGILKVSKFQLEALHPIMVGKRKQKRLPQPGNVFTCRWKFSYFTDSVFSSMFTCTYNINHIQLCAIIWYLLHQEYEKASFCNKDLGKFSSCHLDFLNTEHNF